MNKEFLFLFREEINQYDFGKGHPFHGRRGENFLEFFKKNFPIELSVVKAEKATKEDLLLICDEDYIEFSEKYFNESTLRSQLQEQFSFYHSVDNFPREGSGKIEEAARYIVGQAKMAADLVVSGKVKKAISIGGGLHHAKRNFGEGFCIYNDVAFCAKYLIKKYGLKRILILDTDAHCGNGTMEYFYDEDKVLFIDIHQDPQTLYPGTGFIEQIGYGRGEGFTVNIPLPPFSGDQCFKLVFEKIIEPLAKEFSPQIIIRNGGSDPHFSDPLTSLNLTLEGFLMIGEKTRKIAGICEGKEIDLIASGYNLDILPLAWSALISGLLDLQFKKIKEKEIKEDLAINQTKEIIQKIRKLLSKYWKCF